MGVQNIQETICETPHEEEDCDESNGDDGFSGRNVSSTSYFMVIGGDLALLAAINDCRSI